MKNGMKKEEEKNVVMLPYNPVKAAVQSACIIIAILIGIFFVVRASSFLVLIMVAVVISTGIDPSVTKLSSRLNKKGKPYFPRGIATIIVMAICLLVIAGVVAIIGNTVRLEITKLLNDREMQSKLYDWVGSSLTSVINWVFSFVGDDIMVTPSYNDIMVAIDSHRNEILNYLMQRIPEIIKQISTSFYAVICIILIAFFTIFKTSILDTLIRFVPPTLRRNTITSFNHASRSMGGWLRGQILLACIITTLIAAAMYALNVPYAMVIAIFGGVCELIPMIGPYAAFWPALIILLATDYQVYQLVITIIFFMVLSQVENYYFTPKVMEKNVGLHPLTTIIAIFIGGRLFGVIGALTAIPLTAALRIFTVEVVFPMIEGKKFTELYKEPKPKSEEDEPQTALEKLKEIMTPEKPFEKVESEAPTITVNEEDDTEST